MLNERAGHGNWAKTKQMIDQSHPVEGRDPVPVFAQEEEGNGGWGYAKQVYRGVIFKDAEAASKVRMFVNAVADQTLEDKVLVRSWSTTKVADQTRRYGLAPSGLPWEPKDYNKTIISALAEREEQKRRERHATYLANRTAEECQAAEVSKARYLAMVETRRRGSP